MTYQEAVARHHEWAKQFPGDPQNPNETLSEEHDGSWHLNNINGPLAVVTADGKVFPVAEFWNAYEQLSEDGKCDTPGGAEYCRVLHEWIEEEQPEDMEEFITRRAKPSITVTNDPNYMSDAKRLMTWPEFAAEIFPELQRNHPELRQFSLAEFIEHCPYKIEFVVPSEGDSPK